MKESVFKNLDYLLAIHDCIVIPDLGAFVLSQVNASSNYDGEFTPPSYQVGFNPDLKHDDGMITINLSKERKISYNAASQVLKSEVKAIKKELSLYQSVKCGQLGTLYIRGGAEDKIFFKPNDSYVHPSLYGLTLMSLSRLEGIDWRKKEQRKLISIKQTVWGSAAAVVAAFLLLSPNTTITPETQTADFSEVITKFNSLSLSTPEKPQGSATLLNIPENADVANHADRSYYIIIGGEKSLKRAENILHRIKQSEFPDAKILDSGDRYRIFCYKTNDKKEAEKYLSELKYKNAKYKNAWLFSKKN